MLQAEQQGEMYMSIKAQDKPTYTHVRKLNKQEYVVISTGEIKSYTQAERKHNNVLQRTFNQLRGLIRTNFSNDESCAFLTLTYKDNMQDPKKLYTDYNKFVKRLRHHYQHYNIEYIAVAEPQGRGAWHMHVTIKNNNGKFWISQKKLRELWGHGGAYIERLKSDDIGSYYVAYFTDLLSEDKTSHKKGSRLHMYPPNFRFYRCSRGINKPKKLQIHTNELQKNYKCIYEKAYAIQKYNNATGEYNTINRIYHGTYKRRANNNE